MGNPPLQIELWDGTTIPGADNPICTLHISYRKAMWRLLRNLGLNFGDDYSAGLIELDGDLTEFFSKPLPGASVGTQQYTAGTLRHQSPFAPETQLVVQSQTKHPSSLRPWQRVLPPVAGQGNAVHLYVFPEPTATLEEAQIAKMDLVCRKLRLQPGETVVEAGCG